jgi:hypothetical protein
LYLLILIDEPGLQNMGIMIHIVNGACLAVWILFSGALILSNKYILDPARGGFPYPLALTAGHMVCCTVLAGALIASGVVELQPLKFKTYIR